MVARKCRSVLSSSDHLPMTLSTSQHFEVNPTTQNVPLRSGPPTKEELQVHYPAKFSWTQLKTFVNSGDLGLLKRDKKLQARYHVWAEGIIEKYGSMVNYLLNHRLQWGRPDTQSLLKSSLNVPAQEYICSISPDPPSDLTVMKQLPSLPADAPQYFTANASAEYISIIQNDWPYSVPPEVEHTLIWTRVPIFHADLVDISVKARIDQDGLWGFTGNLNPPPSPSNLYSCLPALADWNVTFDTMIRSEKGTEREEALIRQAGQEVDNFIRQRWSEVDWETAWFVNPPRLQSVPGLAHIHVFARRKLD